MKRGWESVFKKPGGGGGGGATKTPLGHLEFVLLPYQRKVPELEKDFEGFYHGAVAITGCRSDPKLVGATMSIHLYDVIISCASYFVYTTYTAEIDRGRSLLSVKGVLCVPRLKETFGPEDLACLFEETCSALPSNLTETARSLLHGVTSIPSRLLVAMPFFTSGLVHQVSDMSRLSILHTLYPYLVTDSYDVKQQKRVKDMSTPDLVELRTLLMTTPWELVWPKPMRTEYGLKTLTKCMFDRAMDEFNLSLRIPLHMKLAVQIYFKCVSMREDEKHTVFLRGQFNSLIPCMRMEERDAVIEGVYGYLIERGMKFVRQDKSMLACHDDYFDAQRATECLIRVHANSIARPEPKRRGLMVPQLFPALTGRQVEIARHIVSNWLTVVEGLPGTGKTSLVTWCFSHYKNVMLCMFVGMMVKSSQKRNGRRREVAHTIHHLLAVAKHAPEAAAKWFAPVEVLIIEEFSNVSMHLFTKVIRLFPNLSKVVFVGDHRQLKPIECGDPMGDIIDAFGSHVLRDNLRVAAGLTALQEAPRLITEGKAHEIQFSDGGPISFFTKNYAPNTVDVLLPIFSQITKMPKGRQLMNTHIVILLNNSRDGRHAINKACEEAWIKLKVLKPPKNGGVEVRHNLTLYPGAKITFLQNYNAPISVTKGTAKYVSEPIANGELAIVVSIKKMAHGIELVVIDSEDKEENPETKKVWIDAKEGVNPRHVDLGYATTTYKTQGREFQRVIFWNRTDPAEHWTRPHAYVAISRGKEKVWIAGEPSEFFKVCSQLDVKRRTVFREFLAERIGPEHRLPISHYTPSPLLDPASLEELKNRKIPCVYTLADAIADLAKEKKKKEEKKKKDDD